MNDADQEYQPIDEEGEQPVIRAEFNEAMHSLARSFEGVATKDDLKQLATKDELTALEERLSAQIKANGEMIVKALSRHIDTAAQTAVDRRIAPLEHRVARIEKNTGLSPAA